jgi:hypothetical protein
VVSQENSCRFCYAAVRALLWTQGWSETRIERVHQELARAEASSGTAAMIAFARNQSRIGPAGAREAAEALRKAGVSGEEMKESPTWSARQISPTACSQSSPCRHSPWRGSPLRSTCVCYDLCSGASLSNTAIEDRSHNSNADHLTPIRISLKHTPDRLSVRP